jgi:hypothetical protein
MRTLCPEQIIDQWPSLGEFAKDAGVSYGAAKQMRRRNSIPAEHWLAIITAAKARGMDISSELLITAHAKQNDSNRGAA